MLDNFHPKMIDAYAYEASNSREYISAVFRAYREKRIALILPRSVDAGDVPGVFVQDRETFADASGWFDEPLPAVDDALLAQISFSSGTTGAPKPLLLSHRALSDVVGRINAAMELDGTISEYLGVPVTYSFGFGRARAVAAVGGRSFLPANGFDPSEIGAMLRTGEINAISAVPTLWRIALANPDAIGVAGRRVRWIEIGSQYMSRSEKEAMKRLFPNARIVQHYGLTEASRTTLLDISGTEGAALESVGRPTGDVEVAIAADGAIRIRGPHLAEGRVTKQGVLPLTDADGWLTTSDRGRIEDGLLFYEGRTDEIINSGGIKIDPTRFEQRLAERLARPGAVAVGRLPDALRGERILVALSADGGIDRTTVEAAAREVAAEYGLTGGAVACRRVLALPLTPTGKIRRAALADLPELDAPKPDAAPAVAGTTDPAGQAAAIQAIWAAALGMDTVPLDRSFHDLGGDSLSTLTVILRMEAAGIDPDSARGVFEGKTIAEITLMAIPASVASAPTPEQVRAQVQEPVLTLADAGNALHVTRGLLVLWVVVAHWLPGVLARLPGKPVGLYVAIEPLIRFGTPGFALVFGMGVGMLGLPQFRRNPAQFRGGARLKARLVLAGVAAMALLTFGVALTNGSLDDPFLLSAMFYSAIGYYTLALLALPWIVRAIASGPSVMVTILVLFAGSLVIHESLSLTIAPMRLTGLPELVKILLTAKYGFFKMSAYALAGVAVGHLFRQHHDRPGIPATFGMAGGAILVLGLLLTWEARPEVMFDDAAKVMPWHFVVYLGFVVLILAMSAWLMRDGARRFPWLVRRAVAAGVATGILALPIYVGHELVIPARDLLVNLGMAAGLALLIPMALFCGSLAFGYRRLLRMLPNGIRPLSSLGAMGRPRKEAIA